MAYRITILCDNTVGPLAGTLGEHGLAALVEWDGEHLLRGAGGRFYLSDQFREISQGIFLSGEVPRRTSFEPGDAGLFCDDAGYSADLVPDDQSLVIMGRRGLVLLLGCCHAGVVNTIEV